MTHIDLSDVGNSNRLYSDLEVNRILELLSRAKQRFTQLPTVNDISSSIQEASDVRAEISRYEVALAPHRHLPTDILREIFIWCAWNVHSENMVVLHSRRFPQKPPQLSVAHVCSLWRTVAHCTPSLWNNLWIVNLCGRTMRCAKWWLAHAQLCPVSIKISQLTDITMPELRDFLSSYRLKTLHFPLYSSDVATVIPLHSVLHDLPSEHLAHLKEVSIQAFDRAIYDIDLGAIFKAAPNLQYARFPQGRITLSRETLDDLAQCRLAPYLKWLTTGNIAKPFDFLEMIELRQKYAQEHVDSQMTHLGPSPLKYLWVCVDHDKYNSEEMRVNRTIIENLRIQFRLFAHR